MYFMYLWFNIILFSIILGVPAIIYKDFFAGPEGIPEIINYLLLCVAVILTWFSHASAMHQCDQDTGFIKSFKFAYLDTVVYIKLFLNIG